MEIPKIITTKTLEIGTPNCLEVNLFLIEPRNNDESCVLMQAWHWFEEKWHYQSENFYFDFQSTAIGFIRDMSEPTAIDWVKEFNFQKT